MKPIYNSTSGQLQPRKRRRIGQMPERLKNELNAMDKFDRVRMGIAVSMAMVTLLNR